MLRDDEPDLRRYATTLRRWWFVPIVAGLIAAAVAVVSAPDPAAVRTIRVAAADESGPLAATDVLLLPRDLTFSAEVQRLRSDETDAAVAEAIGFSPDVDVEADSGSQTVRIVSRGVTDEQALAAANGYVDAFVRDPGGVDATIRRHGSGCGGGSVGPTRRPARRCRRTAGTGGRS